MGTVDGRLDNKEGWVYLGHGACEKMRRGSKAMMAGPFSTFPDGLQRKDQAASRWRRGVELCFMLGRHRGFKGLKK
jgi:hypothetical protein